MMTFEEFLHWKNRPKPDKSLHGKVKIIDVGQNKGMINKKQELEKLKKSITLLEEKLKDKKFQKGWVTINGNHVLIGEDESKGGGSRGGEKGGSGKEMIGKNPTVEDVKNLNVDLDPSHEGKPNAGYGPLSRVYEEQGYNALPQVVSEDDMDKLVANGSPELYRGVPTQEEVEQFKSGDINYAGQGVDGSGTYTTPDRSMALSYTAPSGNRSTFNQNEDNVMRMTLAPDAKVADLDDISHEMISASKNIPDPAEEIVRELDAQPNLTQSERTAIYDSKINEAHDLQGKIASVFQDEGVYAALRGYDAVKDSSNGIVNILNRGKVVVQK